MIVVGAGIVGVEYATMFATLGVKLTLIDKRQDLLDMVDREIASYGKHGTQYTVRLLRIPRPTNHT